MIKYIPLEIHIPAEIYRALFEIALRNETTVAQELETHIQCLRASILAAAQTVHLTGLV